MPPHLTYVFIPDIAYNLFRTPEVQDLTKYHRREELAGKEVIESEAKKVGVIRDLAYTEEGKLALVVERETEKGELTESFLSFDKIIKIGDVVLIRSIDDLEASPSPGKICPNCRARNPSNAKYCYKCGVTIA
jgi:sporulation protein YlmC with PRC-barrel domain